MLASLPCVTMAHPRLCPVQIVRNVYVIDIPWYLGQCSSLREASLCLDSCEVSREEVGVVLAQLPASLESLTVNVTEGELPVRVLAVERASCHQIVGHVRVLFTCI